MGFSINVSVCHLKIRFTLLIYPNLKIKYYQELAIGEAGIPEG